MSAVTPALHRPVLRYHGGKWRLAQWVLEHLPPHRIYTEAYGGAASVMLRKPRSYFEVYNDLDGELVNMFRVLRQPAQARELVRMLRLTPFARTEFEESYLLASDPIEQARRTIVRAFMGFGSNAHSRPTGFRSKSIRSNTAQPTGWKNYPDALNIIVERLQGVVIENRPALAVINHHDTDQTLHYVDPPYPPSVRDGGSDYRHEMSDDDHRELSECLHSLKGMVVISGYPCELYDNELYPCWNRVERVALADGAQRRIEVLWINEAAWLRQAQRGLF